jgi:arsenate reductase
MTQRVYNVLFLCTGNSARSILAEALLNRHGGGRFRGCSAGSHPTGAVNPLTLMTLREMDIPTEGFRSKSWDEFAAAGAPVFDFVFTVCDSAAREPCPVWPGHPITAHWGIPDPAAVEGSEEERRRAFENAALVLARRIALFISLPIDKLDDLVLKRSVDDIGRR